ncbi:MAG TPA: AAA family ATPase [Brevibacterium sp.]|nr:AAA family ATPase [Brevibacterium sp.]
MTHAPLLVLVDGTSGVGKTTLAHSLARASRARILHMDDLYAGWEGLAHATRTLERILAERAAGRPARWRRWDWWASDWGEADGLAPETPLVVEGCGSVTAVTARFAHRVLWLDAPEPVRRARILARDGDDAWWEGWRRQEAMHRARHRPDRLATEAPGPSLDWRPT